MVQCTHIFDLYLTLASGLTKILRSYTISPLRTSYYSSLVRPKTKDMSASASDAGISVAQRVLGIYELLQMIILHVEPLDIICRARGTNKFWYDCVQNSPSIQRHCYGRFEMATSKKNPFPLEQLGIGGSQSAFTQANLHPIFFHLWGRNGLHFTGYSAIELWYGRFLGYKMRLYSAPSHTGWAVQFCTALLALKVRTEEHDEDEAATVKRWKRTAITRPACRNLRVRFNFGVVHDFWSHEGVTVWHFVQLVLNGCLLELRRDTRPTQSGGPVGLENDLRELRRRWGVDVEL